MDGIATHFVLPRGDQTMVKDAEFFLGQGGDVEKWGRAWVPVVVPPHRRDPRRDPHGIEMARRLGAHLALRDGHDWKQRIPELTLDQALDPSSSRYRQIADRGLL